MGSSRDIVDRLKENIKILKNSIQINSSISNFAKLPELPLQIFFGDISKYTEFIEDFSTNIRGRNDISDKMKLDYLKRSLRGEAFKLVEGIPSEGKNLVTVLEMLKNNYGNPEIIKTHLHGALRKIPRSSPHIPELRQILRQIDTILRQLELMGESIEHKQIMIEIESKLPRWALTELATEKIKTPNLTVKGMREFLDKTVRLKEEVYKMDKEFGNSEITKRSYNPRMQNSINSGINQDRKHNTQNFAPNQNRTFNSKRTVMYNINKETLKCAFCGDPHFNNQCKKYSTIEKRIEKAREKQLCLRCLKNGHSANSCKEKIECFHCKDKRHCSALCRRKIKTGEGQNQSHLLKENKFKNISKIDDRTKNKIMANVQECDESEESGESEHENEIILQHSQSDRAYRKNEQTLSCH